MGYYGEVGVGVGVVFFLYIYWVREEEEEEEEIRDELVGSIYLFFCSPCRRLLML